MPLNLIPASEATSVWMKILLYGNSGAGKTWRACQVRKPGDRRKVLGLLTEANGVQSARHANPAILLPSWPLTRKTRGADGKMVEEPVLNPDTGRPMVRHYATSMKEVREVLSAVQNREIEDLDTLVVDGYTEIQAIMKDEMLQMKEQAVQEGKAKKGSEIFSVADWGELNERMRRFLRLIRDLPVNVAATALAEVETEEDGEVKIRYVIPSFQGKKLHNQAAQFHNVVAYCYTASTRNTSTGKREISRLAMVEGPETIQCKPAHPLTGVLEIPLHEWMDLLERPPESKVGRALTAEEAAALEDSLKEGAKQTQERRAKEEGKAPPEPGDETAGKKKAPETQAEGQESQESEGETSTPATGKGRAGKVRRSGSGAAAK